VQPRSFALAMIRNVRLGQPPLASHQTLWAFEADLECTECPEQGNEDDRALAAALGRSARWRPEEMPRELERAGGIDGLRAEHACRTADDNVISIDSYRR
jgi:hypothetical protein